MPSEEAPDDATLAWAEGLLGPVRVRSRFAHDHGYSRLWRLSTARGFVWLKMHAHPHKWAGEVHALSRWTPSLGLAPPVLGWREEPEAVLLGEVEGRAAEGVALLPEAEGRMWREAGAWLARLHARENDWLGNVRADGSPKDEAATDAEAFARANWESTLAKGRASGLFDARELELTAARVGEGLSSLKGERPRAVHRDYTPRNWMVHDDGRLAGVIDFEHARWDVRAADLNRPWEHEFRRRPRLADAFYDGYGGLDERLRAQVETLRLMLAFNSVVWATGVGDGAFARRNREALGRILGA